VLSVGAVLAAVVVVFDLAFVECFDVLVAEEVCSEASPSNSFLRVTTVAGVHVDGDATSALMASTCGCNEAMKDMYASL
jgi:hypothetical protein